MKKSKLLVAAVVAGGLLASCALIPPIAIGPDALGVQGESFDVGISETGSTGMAVQAASGQATASASFPDMDPPSLPIMPSSLLMDQGFAATVSVNSVEYPDSVTITEGSLQVTVSEQAGEPEPVVVTIPFGPLVLNADDTSCAVGPCTYTFADAEAAASALSGSISGADLSRLIEIVTTGGTNGLALVLDITTESTPDLNGSIELTIEVAENYIRF